MTAPTPNDGQQRLIDNTDGPYLVDAGPGTGKTLAITRRYGAIVEQPEVTPEDVLLVTFTRSAATEMKERIVDRSSYTLREIADAPIRTFHSHCHELLGNYGVTAPTHLGLQGRITSSTRIIEDDLIESDLFKEFFGRFRSEYPDYADFYRILSNADELLDLISELAAKGIFPTADGWYRGGESHLDGDFEAFKQEFDAVNTPRNDGQSQSRLREKLNDSWRDKTFPPTAPSKSEVRGGRGTKQLDEEIAKDVFFENREDLKAFVHDIYYEYLQFALDRNYLNYGFLQSFAFVLLCEDESVRARAGFEYVMIDEFQDTSEIQFKLALLLTNTENLCVVGDWKQSIYSFQYADVRNILSFKDRLERFKSDLNRDGSRVSVDPNDLTRIELTENYRSTGSIIDLSEQAILTPAKSNETVDTTLEDVVELNANASFDNTVIEGISHEDEHRAVVSLIQEIVENDEYAVEDDAGEPRPPTYDDIAVFTRTRSYARELRAVADETGLPMAYDGGTELYLTDVAKLLLAWLRILESGDDRGWAVVLEEAGYLLDEIDHILETGAYPSEFVTFQDDLANLESIGALTRRIAERYGLTGDTADAFLQKLQSVHDSTTWTRGEVIRFLERGIEQKSVVEVHETAGDDSVTLQTIHAAKGLEYPIVILANMNSGAFPPTSRGSNAIQYRDPIGLRQHKVYSESGTYPHVYDTWRPEVLRNCQPRRYDEERRLLYVAITRAEKHVLFAGGSKPNTFLAELPINIQEPSIDIEQIGPDAGEPAELPFSVAEPVGPIGQTPHSLMDDTVFAESGEQKEPTMDDDTEFHGMDLGSRVHDFAEAYALENDVTPSNDHESRIRDYLDGLSGELHVEQPVVLPLEIDGHRVAISGIVDLVHETADAVEVVDYKTDDSRHAHSEYRTQISVYYHVLSDWFAEKSVTPMLFYTKDEAPEEVDPLSLTELEQLVAHRSAIT